MMSRGVTGQDAPRSLRESADEQLVRIMCAHYQLNSPPKEHRTDPVIFLQRLIEVAKKQAHTPTETRGYVDQPGSEQDIFDRCLESGILDREAKWFAQKATSTPASRAYVSKILRRVLKAGATTSEANNDKALLVASHQIVEAPVGEPSPPEAARRPRAAEPHKTQRKKSSGVRVWRQDTVPRKPDNFKECN